MHIMNGVDIIPNMNVKDRVLLATFPINGSFVLGVYQGTLSEFDLLLKYRQRIDGKWSRIRTPKHIHWAVDILIKQHAENQTTEEFLDFLIKMWDEQIIPINSNAERDTLLNEKTLLDSVEKDAQNYSKLANKGEYSIKFLILMAKLLMIQEKTNYEQAYMFRNLLGQLKEHKDLFKIISTATHS